jgi:DNA invertase Pin-like site-specific DNA recombinase
MKIGYVRVSKQEQHEALQIDALKEAGGEKWFLDKITGSKAERKGLDEALVYLRPGDTLVVWKLDRAGRSLPHLIELLKGLKERNIEFVGCVRTGNTGINQGHRGHNCLSITLSNQGIEGIQTLTEEVTLLG